ncbi:tail fiber protein [Paenibacillus illinoisensis]|uniref:tail fiber protein n=1 Tax=Paenibacillus illinoisensis TaxID=59845 RepID=UPI000FDA5174|nr:phage tail protein [Paenibacillus illinoisensis]
MPQETDRLKLPLPLGNENVTRESINGIFEKIDAGVATQEDLDTLREAVSKMDIPDASLTQKGKVQLSSKTDGTSEAMAATEKAVRDARVAAVSAAATDATNKASTVISDAKRYSDGLVGELFNLQTSAKNNTVAAINELFQSGVSAKQLIVDAINVKGGNASTEDTWAVVSSKVNLLTNGEIERLGEFSTPTTGTDWTLVTIDTDSGFYYLDIFVGAGWDISRSIIIPTIFSTNWTGQRSYQWINSSTVRVWTGKYGNTDATYAKFRIATMKNYKSMQQGFTQVDSGIASVSVPIRAVNIANSIIFWGIAHGTTAGGQAISSIRPSFINSTSLKINGISASYFQKVSWFVVEFYNPVSASIFDLLRTAQSPF